MAFDVTQFRAALVGDGARPNLFQVELDFPDYVANGGAAGFKSTFMVSSAALPESILGTAPLFYFGREVKLAGNRQYQPWNVTIINDEDFLIRNAMESWFAGINSPEGNIRDVRAATLDGGYGVDARVTQYSKTGIPIKTYKFVGMFPINISDIALNWQANDQIEEFSVTFDYQYWVDGGSDLGAALALGATVLGEIL
jgi:hypothetical protein